MININKYVNSVYKHVSGNKEEVEILKEEMSNHLLQIVEELKLEGKSEEESISIAIKRFGEETQIENELLGIFKFVNKKAKRVLMIAAVFLLMAVLSFSTFVIGTELSIKQYNLRNDKIFNAMSDYNSNNIDNINKNISSIFNDYKRKTIYISMFRVPNGEDMWYKDLKDLEYLYPANFRINNIDKSDSANKQITTKDGIKYNVKIGNVPNANIPLYIQNIGKLSSILFGLFFISIITWGLVKIKDYADYRH